MSEQNNMASNLRKETTRKEPRQISFRVSESEYLKLKESAETLNLSVPNFCKKKAQGARLVAPKFDFDSRKSIARQLSGIANNTNQIAKYVNNRREENADMERLNINIEKLRKELNEVWQRLN